MTNELWLRDDLVHVLNIVFSFTYSCMAVSEKAEAYYFWNLGGQLEMLAILGLQKKGMR